MNKKRTECQIFSRVCGWLVPRHAMNPGKQSERQDMTEYILKENDICKE